MSRLGTHMRMMILRSPAAPVSDCEKAPVPPYGLVSSPRTWAARRLEALSIALPTSRASTGSTLRGRVRAPATDACAAENPETSTSPRRSTAAASRHAADRLQRRGSSARGQPTGAAELVLGSPRSSAQRLLERQRLPAVIEHAGQRAGNRLGDRHQRDAVDRILSEDTHRAAGEAVDEILPSKKLIQGLLPQFALPMLHHEPRLEAREEDRRSGLQMRHGTPTA